MEALRLMCILAHPDDETMGVGGLLAKSAAEGIETYVVCATLGQQGWSAAWGPFPGAEELGRIRAAELAAACAVLGVKEVTTLGHMDGALAEADAAELTACLVGHLRRVRPQVVVTFGPDGAYGHPDHIAISQATTAATVCAADSGYAGHLAYAPHRVAKLYYFVVSQAEVDLFTRVLGGDITITVDGTTRGSVAWADWALTTQVDATAHWETVWAALQCHATQVQGMRAALDALPIEDHRALWGRESFYRAYSLVNGGRGQETDLFAGIRTHHKETK
jgi:LmbE family N-acetylglucosaminyl deacetylase